jgi:NAD(P)-dependent dehydrogenase (short-subunit alcohol dehydrogenase family)
VEIEMSEKQNVGPQSLQDRVAFVTGGGRGIGRAIAQELAGNGARVAVFARSERELAETVALIAAAGGSAAYFTADVADAEQVNIAFAKAATALGPADVLVNNAGALGELGPFAENDMAQWWRTFEVNLRGPANCTQAVLPAMIARRAGRIINVASGGGTQPMANFSSYVISKTALIRMSEVLAIELAAHGITAFSISPGTVSTAMAEYSRNSEAGKKWLPWFEKIFENGLNVPPERAGQLVAQLASGKMDALSGRYFAVSDDLDALLQNAEEIHREKLYSLRMRTLASGQLTPAMAAIRAAAEHAGS